MLRQLTVPLLFVLSLPVLLGTVERLVFVSAPPPNLDVINQRYADHPFWTWVHLAPGLLFFLFGPLQFSQTLRQTLPVHRWFGRLFLVAMCVSGVGVLVMVIVFPALGGRLTQVTTFLVIGAMLICAAVGWRAIGHRDVPRHKAYMARCFALGLSVSTARLFIEAADMLFALPFESSFVWASALGVITNVISVEVAISRRWI